MKEDQFNEKCFAVDGSLRNNWGKLVKTTSCEQVKVFIKKQLVLWESFCSFDNEFRQGY